MVRVYQAATMGEADVRIALVRDEGRADLLAYRASGWGTAHGDAFWYITRNRQDANLVAYFCDEGFAELKVCFVATRGDAGWRRPHRLQGRLGRG